MTVDGFVRRFPRAWHVVEAEGVRCDILYPAATLRRLAGLPDERTNRDAFQRLTLPDGGLAIIRMQLMADDKLTPTLNGAFSGRPDRWRDHINQHVFFWVTPERRDRFIAACVRSRARDAIGAGPMPVIIECDVAALLTAHSTVASFSRINTGSTLRGGGRTKRDETTLRPVRDWRGGPAAELAIREPVPLGPVATTRYPAPAAWVSS